MITMRSLLIALLFLLPAQAQFFAGRPWSIGTAANKPAACASGTVYFATDAAAGSNLYFCQPANTWTQMTGGGSNIISAPVTYYVATAGTTTCTYAGDAGTACTPSDANTGLTKAAPFATLSQVATVLANSLLAAKVTVQLANATGSLSHAPNAVTFTNPALGTPPVDAFSIISFPFTDSLPVGLIDIVGDTTTPGNVVISGATTPGGTTAGNRFGIIAQRTNLRLRGVRQEYFKGTNTAPGAMLNCMGGALCYVDAQTGVGSTNDAEQTKLVQASEPGTLVKLSGTISTSNMGIAHLNNLAGLETVGPGGKLSVSMTAGTSQYAHDAFLANEGSHIVWYCADGSFTGTGGYNVFRAQQFGSISVACDGDLGSSTNITFNNANMTPFVGAQGGYVYSSCSSTGVNCTFTSIAKMSKCDSGGVVENTTVPSTWSTADVQNGTCAINYAPFTADPRGLFQISAVAKFKGMQTSSEPGTVGSSDAFLWFNRTTKLWMQSAAGVAKRRFDSPSLLSGSCSGTATSSTTISLFGLGTISALTCTANDALGPPVNNVATVGNMRLVAGTGGVNASSGVCTVYQNGVSTAITATFGTGTTASNTANTITTAVGDRLEIRCTTQATETLANIRGTLEVWF